MAGEVQVIGAWLGWLLVGAALAVQEHVLYPSPSATYDDEGRYEVRVYGTSDVEAARRAVREAAREAGWRYVRTRRGADVFRSSPWMGAMLVDHDGVVRFRRRIAVFDLGQVRGLTSVNVPPGEDYPYKYVSREFPPPQAALLGGHPGRRKARGPRATVLGAIRPALRDYRGAVQGLALQEFLAGLARQLDDLWYEGTPLSAVGGERLGDMRARRRAVLDYWASRTDTPEGDAVCEAVEVWLEEVVQASEHPVTIEEQERANATASHGRQLDLPQIR